MKACRREGLTLLNQSVLLRRVNDGSQTLSDLSEALFDCGVLPYYLHLLDRATGAAKNLDGPLRSSGISALLRAQKKNAAGWPRLLGSACRYFCLAKNSSTNFGTISVALPWTKVSVSGSRAGISKLRQVTWAP